jgi:hypothetical protein
MHNAGHQPRAFIIFAGTASEPDKFFRRRWESDDRRNGDLWMLKYIIAASALLAGSTFAYAAEMDRGDRGAASTPNAASEHAPGQVKGNGAARDAAPGNMKQEGRSAREHAPGQAKDSSASRTGDRNMEHRAGSDDRLHKSDRNAKGESSKSKNDRNAKDEGSANRNERNARGEGSANRDRKVDQSRADERRGNSGTGASEGTEGRSEHSGSIANVSPEQKTRITTIFSHHHVAPVRDLDVAVNVGVVIPHSVHVYPVPIDIVTIVPDYRGYMYFMIDDNRVAIVDPDTYEVVDVIVIA